MHNTNDIRPEDSGAGRDLSWLITENARLRRLLRYVLFAYADLEGRIERIENSVVFRFLRFVGAGLTANVQHRWRLLLHSMRRPRARESAADDEYSAWVDEVEWASPSLVDCRRISEGWSFRPLLSLFVYGQFRSRTAVENTIASIAAQAYSRWELFICAPAPVPDWLGELVASLRQQSCPVELIFDNSLPLALRLGLERARGEYAALVPEGVLLNVRAAYAWVEALQRGSAHVIYSDWDHVDAAGTRHTPRFTPEFSPELLLQTLYWGPCFMVNMNALRDVNWPGAAQPGALEHDLALRLVERGGSIVRVPRILSHLQQPETALNADAIQRVVKAALERRQQSAIVVETDQAGVVRLRRPSPADSASIVICSRTPALLDRCLRSLQPTLESRHEVIVVAHATAAAGTKLDQVAERHGAKAVLYRGAFHFGVMNELGVSRSSGSTLVFLNDDVCSLESGWLDTMLAQAAQQDVGVVGALLLYRSRSVQHAGVVVGGRLVPGHVGRGQLEAPYWPWLRISREVTAVTGACLALRRSVWDELGGFDLRFPVNYSDIGLCLRARRAGYRVLLETQALLIHDEAQTRIPVVRPRERELFYELWGDAIETSDPFFNPNLAIPHERIVLAHPWAQD